MKTPRNAELFESTPCTRCDGSGRYSFNQIDGSRCYGCGGTGVRFTKRGQAALEAWRAEYRVTKKAEQVVPGDVVLTSAAGGRRVAVTVSESEPDPLNAGQNRWNLRFQYPNRAGLGGQGTFIGSDVELATTVEQKREAYGRIVHMPGALGWTA